MIGWRELKWFVQRGRRGWADCDTWDFPGYLTPILADMLAHLRQHGGSYACLHDLSAATVEEVMSHECTPELWHNLLLRIEYGLRYYLWAENYSDLAILTADEETRHEIAVKWHEVEERGYKAAEMSFALLGKYWAWLWD